VARQALGLSIALRISDLDLESYLSSLLCDLTPSTSSGLVEGYEIPDPAAERVYQLLRDGREVNAHFRPGSAADALLGDLNLRAIEASRHLLLLHAGACAIGDDAVVLCGQSGSGKTTLTAGLVESGLDYLTDETVALDPDDLTIVPWPKPLTLKRGSWPVLPHLAPEPGSLAERFTSDVWHVPASRIRPGSVAGPGTRPRAVVLPSYTPGAGVRLEPVSRGEAAMTLFEQTSYGADHGPRVVDLLCDLLEPCTTHRLLFDDHAGAVEAVRSLLP